MNEAIRRFCEEEVRPFKLYFDLMDGSCKCHDIKPIYRYLSDMKEQFFDKAAAEAQIDAAENPVVYRYYTLPIPDAQGELQFGTSVVYPGSVNGEFYMTKGHFHSIIDTSEVYYCLDGKGAMVMETPEGVVDVQQMQKGDALYVPPRFAHRSVNTGDKPLVLFFAYRADAGHDYATIEEKGFRVLLLSENGETKIVDNPKWKA